MSKKFNIGKSWPDALALELRAHSFDPVFLKSRILGVCGKLPESPTILEVGCNGGSKTPLFQTICPDFKSYTGIDIDSDAINRSLEKYGHKEGMKFLVSDFLSDTLGRYDVIFLAAVWHHFLDTRTAVSQIKKHLSPNGVCVLLDTFVPDNLILRAIANTAHRAYTLLLHREDTPYNHTPLSDTLSILQSVGLDAESFPANFPTTIFNTHCVVTFLPKTLKDTLG